MKRKEFIQLSAFTVVAISFPLLDSCRSPVSDAATGQPAFLSKLFDEVTIKKTGQAYLQKTPAENAHDELVRLLANDSTIANSSDEAAIHQYLEEKIKNDFDEGKTVTVNGWVLSVTEARQCALFSLIKS
jgi:hypothetical protein